MEWKFALHNRHTNSSVTTGQFTFRNVFVGDFVATAANPFSPGQITAKEAIPAPNATRTVTLSLQSTGVVTGVVLLPDGTPATQPVLVKAKVATAKEPIIVVTDNAGRFHFPLMPAGGFTLSAEEDYGNRLVGQSQGFVSSGQTVAVPVQLLRTGSVTVTVLGNGASAGEWVPVSGATVTLNEGAFTQRVHEQGQRRQRSGHFQRRRLYPRGQV